MILFALLLAAAQAAPAPTPAPAPAPTPAPTPEAAALGRQVAMSGALSTLLPLVATKEVGELIEANPDLTPADQAKLRAVADRRVASTLAAMAGPMGDAYARSMSVDDMKAVIAFTQSDAAKHWRAAEPGAMVAVAKTLAGFDFKSSVTADFCKETGKLCPPPPEAPTKKPMKK